jgi:eukaryotic-like serine/threonine-protein kinase
VNTSFDQLTSAIADRYRIERELGHGGMATVYLAQDLRHDRKVAVKVLRPELAAVIGAERFLTEIKTTAALQHPHILPLFDSGHVGSFLFYVMPFVEGESLRDRLNRETQLPIHDAVRIATEVASALDYAHRHQVIHRDIKPENIMLHDGQALVADFGIALAVSAAGGARMTETGMSLGTPHYMSPEQAMGERTLDARTDVYALGCVLYEMLVGEPPFTGPTAQAVVAKVMTEKPTPVRHVRETVPETVEEAVLTALAKLPADRFAGPAEFAAALSGPTTSAPRPPHPISRAAPLGGRKTWVGWVVAVIASLVAVWGWLRPPPPGPVIRSVIANLGAVWASDLPVLSPDGSRIVFADSTNPYGVFELDQDQLEAKRIPGTENGLAPFFSPDGKTLGMGTGYPGTLKLVSLDGGSVTTLVGDSVSGWGGAWSDDGWIYYIGGNGGTLMRIRPAGSSPETVAKADPNKDELLFTYPDVLPDGRHVLVTIIRIKAPSDIAVVDVGTHEIKVLTQGVRGYYTRTGHLVFLQGDGTLMAAHFDLKRLAISSRPVALVEGIRVEWGTPRFSISRNGTLLYHLFRPRAQVVRVQRDGREQPVDSSWTGDFGTVALSPRGDRLAVSLLHYGSFELWVKELDHGPFTRLASGGTLNYRPSWAPDGRSLLFLSDHSGLREALFSIPADGSSEAREILSAPRSVDEGFWSRDGKWVIYRIGSGSRRDIYGLRFGVDSPPGTPLAATDAEESSPALSADGHWLAYTSNESGRLEIYVRPFPEVGTARQQVSRNGGIEALWANTKRELYYRDLAGNLIAVEYAAGDRFTVTSQHPLFNASAYWADGLHASYAIDPNDRTFYFVRRLPDAGSKIVLVRNWFQELKAAVPP